LITNGFDVAVLEHHVSSSYAGFTNTYSQARIAYYNISGIPNSFFDGILSVLGGSTGTYNQFLTKYNQRIAIPCNFMIALNGFNEGNNYSVVATMENVEPYSGTNLVLQFFVSESHLIYSSSEFNYVTRLAVPGSSGTPVSFTSGTVQSVMLEFSMNASWLTQNCEFVAFIQDNSTKEILQATKVAVNDLMPMYYNNAGCTAIHMLPVTNCSGEVAPEISIINEGAEYLTAVDINYSVNNEPVSTFSWTGNLGYGQSELVTLPALSFNLMNDNDLMIYSSNPNGNPDEETSNDTLYTSFISAMEVVPNIYVYIKLDDNPQETTWECRNSAGDILYSGGPYMVPQQFVKDTLFLTEDDCYTFTIYDSGGDGLVGGTSGFTLRQNDFSTIYQNNDFEYSEELVQFAINLISVPDIQSPEPFVVYPNPFRDYSWVSFSLDRAESVELTIYNSTGNIVYQTSDQQMEAGNHNVKIETKQFAKGIYFISLKTGDKVYTRKISSN
jgi:hypothetical protein